MRGAIWGLRFLVLSLGCGDDDDATTTDGGADSGGGGEGEGEGEGVDAGPDAEAPSELVDHVVDHGVTWTFSAPVRAGRFVTGDTWIICPATVSAIDPAPAGGRNGSVLNLPPVQDRSGFDERTAEDSYDPGLLALPPIAMAPGDRLVSSISVETVGAVDNWLREGEGKASDSPVWSVSVLTCLAEPPSADAFRPSYADPAVRIYRLGDVERALLPVLAPPAAVDPATLEDFATRFGRPWIDNLFFGFDAQVEYMAMYGREMARSAAIASLLLMVEVPEELRDAKERLLVGFVQHGIDLWGLVRNGHPGWEAFGGHGSGRKWPIVLSGMLLGDAEMATPSTTFPNVWFGEDMHTSFATDLAPPNDSPGWWNDVAVVYTGHMGVWNGVAVSDDPGWGPYEHLAPEDWPDPIGENYRRCCTSIAWVGEALGAHLVGAEEEWAHDAFFAYVDRWMDPSGDAEYTQAIFDRAGLDYRAAWQAHGQAWDDFVEQMWASYR